MNYDALLLLLLLLEFFVQISLLFAVSIKFFLKVIRNPASKSLRSIEYRHILHLRMNEMLPKKKKILMNELFYLEILFC